MGAQDTISHGGLRDNASCPIPVHGAISEMGIHRRWPPQKRPSYETGEKGVGRAADRGEGGRVICLTLTQFPDVHKY